MALSHTSLAVTVSWGSNCPCLKVSCIHVLLKGVCCLLWSPWPLCAEVETGLETGTQDGAPRSKISVSLKKSAQFDSLYAASQAAEEAAEQ